MTKKNSITDNISNFFKSSNNNTLSHNDNSSDDAIAARRNDKKRLELDPWKKVGTFLKSVLNYIIILILIPFYFGINIVFLKWTTYTECDGKKILDYLFPIGDNKDSEGNTKKGKSITELQQGALSKEIKDFCNLQLDSNKKMSEAAQIKPNPNATFAEWSYAAKDKTNIFINKFIQNIILSVSGWNCTLNFLLAGPILFITLFCAWFIAGPALVVNTFLLSPSVWYTILLIIILFIALITGLFSGGLTIYGIIIFFTVFAKLYLYPMILGGKKNILKVVKENLFSLSILIWICNLAIVSESSQLLKGNYLTLLLVIYIPIAIYHLYKIVTGNY